MKTRFITMQINALEIYLPRQPALTFISIKYSIPPKININFTLDRYKVFRRRICTEPGSEQVGSVLVLSAEVVQVGPIQMFGPKQNYSSKHLDRTSTGPGSEQLRRLNNLKDADQLRGKLISTFAFATQILQSLFLLNPKFQTSSHLM